jgi:hypothetical protein
LEQLRADPGIEFIDLAAREHLIVNNRCTGKVGPAGFYMGAGSCLKLASAPDLASLHHLWVQRS